MPAKSVSPRRTAPRTGKPLPLALSAIRDWFDPLEEAVRGQVRAFIKRLLEEELAAALGRGRYERGMAGRGHRNGHRERRLDTTFGPLVLAVPRARLADDEAGEREWKSALLPAYRRLSRRAELLIAEVYLAGVNTRRVRRALQTLFAGCISKDAVSSAFVVKECSPDDRADRLKPAESLGWGKPAQYLAFSSHDLPASALLGILRACVPDRCGLVPRLADQPEER
jgi:hypothetical protein